MAETRIIGSATQTNSLSPDYQSYQSFNSAGAPKPEVNTLVRDERLAMMSVVVPAAPSRSPSQVRVQVDIRLLAEQQRIEETNRRISGILGSR